MRRRRPTTLVKTDARSRRPKSRSPSDEVAAAIVERFAGTVFVESTASRSSTSTATPWPTLARVPARRAAVHDVRRRDRGRPSPRRRARTCPPASTAERFEVVANFLSHARNRRIRADLRRCPPSRPVDPSLADLYPGANFAEREAYDLFGITFDGHPDLTRILMPDDWDGHPLRKDDAPARVPVTFKGDPSPR